jgi:hypothetical protein
VFFLHPDELDAALNGGVSGLRHDIGLCNAQHAFWQSKEPPLQIGAVAPAAAQAPAASTAGLIQGIGARAAAALPPLPASSGKQPRARG